MTNNGDMEVLNIEAEICRALCDSKRLYMVKALREREMNVHELTQMLGISQSNTSQHIAILRKLGIIIPRKNGSTIYYRLASPKIAEACDLVNQFVIELIQNQKLLLRR